MRSSPIRYWQIDGRSGLAWRHWADEFVCHHILSNDTHRLSLMAGRVLCELQAGHRRSQLELAESLHADAEEIDDILEQLLTLGFVECL